MLVLVNNATRFTVAIYQVKRKDLKNVAEMMRTAILNTLLYMNLNPELVGEYMRLAGEVEFTQNRNRQTAAWVTKAGLDCAFYVGREYNSKVLQSVFDWKNCHLYNFAIFDGNNHIPVARLVPFEEDLEYDEGAILMEGHVLSEFFPEHKHMLYTYDMGDNWEHEIQLVRVIEGYDKELPYLLEESGQTPPKDVGGVGGFVNFREIILNPSHPEYGEMKEWAKYWTIDLSDWKSRPKVIHY